MCALIGVHLHPLESLRKMLRIDELCVCSLLLSLCDKKEKAHEQIGNCESSLNILTSPFMCEVLGPLTTHPHSVSISENLSDPVLPAVLLVLCSLI